MLHGYSGQHLSVGGKRSLDVDLDQLARRTGRPRGPHTQGRSARVPGLEPRRWRPPSPRSGRSRRARRAGARRRIASMANGISSPCGEITTCRSRSTVDAGVAARAGGGQALDLVPRAGRRAGRSSGSSCWRRCRRTMGRSGSVCRNISAPRRAPLARGAAAAEILAGQQDRGVAEPRLVEHEIGVLAPGRIEKRSDSKQPGRGLLRPGVGEPLDADHRVGVDVGTEQRWRRCRWTTLKQLASGITASARR